MMKEACSVKILRSMDSKGFEVGMSGEQSEHRSLFFGGNGRT